MKRSAAVLVLALAASAQAGTPPTTGAKAFEGQWNGVWDNQLPTTLVVEPISPRAARVIYEWGASDAWKIDTPGFVRSMAEIEGNKLVTAVPGGGTAIYVLQPDGTLAATLIGPFPPPKGGTVHATMRQ